MQIELILLIRWPEDGEIILYYLDGPNTIAKVFVSGRGRQEKRECQSDAF